MNPVIHNCEDCAPEFGCFDGSEPCYKKPLVKSTPAPHADTVRLNQRSIQLHVYSTLTGEWEPTIFEDVDLRAAIDSAMNGGANG